MARVRYIGWFKNYALVGNANHKIQVLNELYTTVQCFSGTFGYYLQGIFVLQTHL